jgi:hypothetical protein
LLAAHEKHLQELARRTPIKKIASPTLEVFWQRRFAATIKL